MSDDELKSLRDQSLRAENARQVIENPAYSWAIKALQQQIVDDWSQCPVRDKEGQTLYLQLHKLSKKFEALLTGMVETGKLAQLKLDAERDESAAQKLVRRFT